MNDDGDTKDDVKVPDGEVGDKIKKLFKEEEKDTSKFHIPLTDDPCAGLTPDVDVIILASMGEECAIDAKEAPK